MQLERLPFEKYKYKLISTGESSSRYGPCEVCGKHVSEVYHQIEWKYFRLEHYGKVYEGWIEHSNLLSLMEG